MSRSQIDTIDASEYQYFRTERELQSAIEQQCRQLGFKVYHTRISQGSQKGFPDLCICGHGLTLFVECKGPKGRVSKAQEEWIAELKYAGNLAFVASTLNPGDFDRVVTILQDAYESDFRANR